MMSESQSTDTDGRNEILVEQYRPDNFDDIAGQEDIIDTLRSYVNSNDLPNLMFSGPAGTGKTTSAVTIAKQIYGDDWTENFIELNASDDRGINVVRERIKEFARSTVSGYDYRLIFLDEADSLTDDAQSALRRTMEQFSSNTRFILSCNYSSQIIDPIQSRCAVCRFTSLSDEAVSTRISEIAASEDINMTDDALDAIVYTANGDMRRAVNALQAAAVNVDPVDAESVYSITASARPEEVETLVATAIEGDYLGARKRLTNLTEQRGMSGGDILSQIHRLLWDFDLSNEAAVDIADLIGQVDYRIKEGADAQIQLESLLARIAKTAENN